MGWFGKVLGGTLGFAFGGPLGAVLGAALGHVVDHAAEEGLPKIPGDTGGRTHGFGYASAQEQNQAAFFVTTFALLGKMAKADGQVTPDEIKTVERYMEQLGFDAKLRRLAIQVFQEAKNSPVTHRDYANQFAQIFGAHYAMKVELVTVLHAVAMADGDFHPNEQEILRDVIEILGLPASTIDGLGAPGPGAGKASSSHYALLGVKQDDDWDAIKSRYRELAKTFHPDTLVAKGLPDEFVDMAKEKLQAINNAYDAIKRERGK